MRPLDSLFIHTYYYKSLLVFKQSRQYGRVYRAAAWKYMEMHVKAAAEQQAEYVIIEIRKSKLLLPKPAGAFSNT